MSERITIEINETTDNSKFVTYLYLNPPQRRVYSEEQLDDHSTPMDAYHRRILGFGRLPHDLADTSPIVEWLEEEAQQQRLLTICDGWDEEWDGHNVGGTLTEAALAALQDLSYDFEEWIMSGAGCARLAELQYWSASDWYAQTPAIDILTVDILGHGYEDLDDAATGVVETADGGLLRHDDTLKELAYVIQDLSQGNWDRLTDEQRVELAAITKASGVELPTFEEEE